MNKKINIMDNQKDIPNLQVALRKQYKEIHQENLRSEKQDKTASLLEEYHRLYSEICKLRPDEQNFHMIFNPMTFNLFFYTYKKRLFYTGNTRCLLIEVKDIPTFFKLLGMNSIDPVREREFLNHLRMVMNLTPNTAFSDYQHHVIKYKIENKIENEFYLDNPLGKFHYANNTLFGLSDGQWVCLTQQNIKAIMKKVSSGKVDESFWKKLVLFLPMELERLYSYSFTPIITPTNNKNIPEGIDINTKEYVYANTEVGSKKIIYDGKSASFITINDDSKIPNQIVKLHLSQPPILSENARQLLYYIFGDIDTMRNYAKFIASCVSPELLIKELIILSGDALTCETIKAFTDKIICLNGNTSSVSRKGKLSYFNRPENIPQLLKGDSDFALHYNQLDLLSKPTTYDFANVQKMILGKAISKPDVIMKKITYRNSLPFVYYSTNHNIERWLQTYFPCQVIAINGFVKNIEHIEHLLQLLTQSDWQTLKAFFVLYGLTTFSLPKTIKAEEKNTNPSPDKDEAVETFLSNYCITDASNSSKSFITYGTDLYNAYVMFFEKKYKFEPLKKKPFIAAINAKGIYKYKRPRSSTKDYTYAFIGIKVDHDKLQEFVNEIPKEDEIIDDEIMNFKEFITELACIQNEFKCTWFN